MAPEAAEVTTMVGVGSGVALGVAFGVGNTLTEPERVMEGGGTTLVTPEMLLLLQLTKIDDSFSVQMDQIQAQTPIMSQPVFFPAGFSKTNILKTIHLCVP